MCDVVVGGFSVVCAAQVVVSICKIWVGGQNAVGVSLELVECAFFFGSGHVDVPMHVYGVGLAVQIYVHLQATYH